MINGILGNLYVRGYQIRRIAVQADQEADAQRRRRKSGLSARANWMDAGYLVSQERMYADGALNLCHLG